MGKQLAIQIYEPGERPKVLDDQQRLWGRGDPFRDDMPDGADDDRLDAFGPDDAADEFVRPHRNFRFQISETDRDARE